MVLHCRSSYGVARAPGARYRALLYIRREIVKCHGGPRKSGRHVTRPRRLSYCHRYRPLPWRPRPRVHLRPPGPFAQPSRARPCQPPRRRREPHIRRPVQLPQRSMGRPAGLPRSAGRPRAGRRLHAAPAPAPVDPAGRRWRRGRTADGHEHPSWRPSAFTGTRTGPRHALCFTCETSCADVRRGAGSRFKLGSLCIEYGDEWPVSDRVVSFQPVLLDRSQGLRVIRNAR